MKLRLLLFFLCCTFATISAQDFPQNYFRAPLDIPMYLSGNFGELRSAHYHSGLDIKTQGREGFPVFAAAEGFVSRIKVSPYGYGNTLYIAHPNGYTTVYAHLQKFSPKIDGIAKRYQYTQESFAIDEMLAHDLLVVKKGDIIALSGNSGSSGGPHLHFEIRETVSEFPTNPLGYGFDIQDDVPPVIRSVFLYPLSSQAKVEKQKDRKHYKVVKKDDFYTIAENQVPTVSGSIGFAIDARDYMNGTHNYYGIYKLRLYVDNELQHSFTFDKFSFAESRYINAHIDYDLYTKHRRRIHKIFHESNQEESFAEHTNKGIRFFDNKEHDIRIRIADAAENTVELRFRVQSVSQDFLADTTTNFWWYNQNNSLETADFFARMPAMTFYKDVKKQKIVAKICARKDSYSPLYHFLGHNIPLHKEITVGIKPSQLPLPIRGKAFLAKENKGRYCFIGNTWEGEFLTGKTNEMGNFTVLVDSFAPEIALWKGSSYKKTGKLRYKITDALSGIKSYRGTIDGKWVLFQYDAKRNLLWHTLSASKITKGETHQLVLEVKDACGNSAVRETSFVW